MRNFNQITIDYTLPSLIAQLVFFVCSRFPVMLFGFPGISNYRAAFCICQSLCLIHHGVYYDNLYVLDDSLTRKRLTAKTEQLNKCNEPLEKLRMKLGPCKTGLSPPSSNFILFFVPVRYFMCGSNCFGVDFCADCT